MVPTTPANHGALRRTATAHHAEQPERPLGSQNGVMAMPRLHPRTIDAVKERADIVDVVGEHVVLKKKGKGICWRLPLS